MGDQSLNVLGRTLNLDALLCRPPRIARPSCTNIIVFDCLVIGRERVKLERR